MDPGCGLVSFRADVLSAMTGVQGNGYLGHISSDSPNSSLANVVEGHAGSSTAGLKEGHGVSVEKSLGAGLLDSPAHHTVTGNLCDSPTMPPFAEYI